MRTLIVAMLLGLPLGFAHQIVAQQNAMDGAGGQPDSPAVEQHSQLAHTPVRVTLAQQNHALLQLIGGLIGRAVRTLAALGNGRHTTLAVAIQP